MEYYIKKKKLPEFAEKLAIIIKKILFWIFEDNTKKVEPKKETTKLIKIDDMNEEPKKEKIVESDVEKNSKPVIANKCNFCERCNECQKEFDKEKKKKDDQKLLESNATALNYLAFFILFLTIFVCNLSIWITIGTYKN